MPETTTPPTKEEFEAAVKKVFMDLWPSLTEAEADEYLKSDEAREVINNSFKQNQREYESGEISVKQFLTGGSGQAGYCLSMMY